MEQDKSDALASLTTGLYLLTTGTVDEPSGMIVSWVSQVSYEPPLVLAAVRKNRYLHDIIQRSGCFGLNVLERGQEDFLPFFKNTPRLEKFKNLELFKADTGAPLAREARSTRQTLRRRPGARSSCSSSRCAGDGTR